MKNLKVKIRKVTTPVFIALMVGNNLQEKESLMMLLKN
jgi:hypothetical protein